MNPTHDDVMNMDMWLSTLNVEMARRILASHADVFKGARFSPLPTNCGEGWKTSSPKNACVGG